MNQEDGNFARVSRPLREMNPWWEGRPMQSAPPATRRHIWKGLERWLSQPTDKVAVNIVGPRYAGKTTVLYQLIEQLLSEGVPGTSILYAKFDDHRLDNEDFNAVVDYWLERHAGQAGRKYLLFDEIQFARHWRSSVKNMVDDYGDRKILFTGSALSLSSGRQETGVGRWIDRQMGTLSFGEYLEITGQAPNDVPEFSVLEGMAKRDRLRMHDLANHLNPIFGRYLLQGGLPRTAMLGDLAEAHGRLIDQTGKLISRELPAIFNIDNYWDLKNLHMYLTNNDCDFLNYSTMSSYLEVAKPTVKKMLYALEAGKMINMLRGMSRGKEILKGRRKVYITDQSTVAALLGVDLDGIDGDVGGKLVESAVFHHLHQATSTTFDQLAYWRDNHQNEVDFVVRLRRGGECVPIEAKHRDDTRRRASSRGLEYFYRDKKFQRCYMVTKSPSDIGQEKLWPGDPSSPTITRLPAPVFCLLQSKPEPGRNGEPWI